MDEFDRFIAALVPSPREPDRLFGARVQAQLRLEARLAAERRRFLSRLSMELLAVAALAAALIVLASSPAIGEFASRSPALALAAIAGSFGFLVVTFTTFAVRTARS